MVLDGSTKSNHEHALWSRINGVAKRWIFSSVSGLMIGNVPGKNTNYDMWKSLVRNFISTSKTHVMEINS